MTGEQGIDKFEAFKFGFLNGALVGTTLFFVYKYVGSGDLFLEGWFRSEFPKAYEYYSLVQRPPPLPIEFWVGFSLVVSLGALWMSLYIISEE